MVRTYTVRRATFNGKHNHTKALVLLLLSRASNKLSVKTIQYYTGLSFDATRAVLWRLHKWHYVNCGRYSGVNYYSIGVRGVRFLDYVPPGLHQQHRTELLKRLP